MKAIIFILALTTIFCEELEFDSHIDISNFLNNGTSFVNMINDTWKNVTSALKTTKSKVYKEMINGEGFKRFSYSCMGQVSIGVRNWDVFTSSLIRKTKMPEEQSEIIKSRFRDSKYGDKNAWYGLTFGFSTKSSDSSDKDNATFGSLFINYVEKKNSPDALFSYCRVNFNHIQNFMIFTKGISVAGGIYQKQEDVIEEIPKNITKEDIEALMNGFFLITTRNLAKMFQMNTTTLVFPS